MSNIHHTAIIEDGAKIAASVKIGPYSVIGKNVVLKENVELKSHVIIENHTIIGEGSVIHPFAVIGGNSQDMKYDGGDAFLEIGKNCLIREHVTINAGNTEGNGRKTVVKDNCWIMTAAHIAHDCVVGNNVIMANNATLAGHVILGDNVRIGGLSAVRQFVRIGDNAMIGGMSGIENDVIPYGIAYGERAHLQGLNLIGLKRSNFSRDQISDITNAYKTIFEDNDSEDNFSNRISLAESKFSDNNIVLNMIKFLKEDSSLPICKPKVRI